MNVSEIERLSHAVADFGEAMRKKLWKKYREGYTGWSDDSDPCVIENLREKLDDHVRRYFGRPVLLVPLCDERATDPAQLVDIANLAMMLWRLEVEGKGKEGR